jgi:GNAT superfamily N-acetyltransferase
MSVPDSPHRIECRELRRSDLPGFTTVLAQGIGALERAVGIDQTSEEMIGSLRRPGIWVLLSFLRLIGVAPVRLYVGTLDRKVVGTTILVLLPETGYIAGVSTDAAARGRGVATHVIETAQATARTKGKRWFALDVESENETAIRVYRRLGYAEAARYGWYTGATPDPPPPNGTLAHEVKGFDRPLREWADRLRPQSVRSAVPATKRSLQHLELITRANGLRTKRWVLGEGGALTGAATSHYIPSVRIGFVYPSLPPDAADGVFERLVAPGLRWVRAEGATKLVVVGPDPPGSWAEALARLGVIRSVSTVLMVRPAAP